MNMENRKPFTATASLDDSWFWSGNMKRIIITCIIAAVLLSLISCGGGKADENAAIKDTIQGYITTFNAEDFDNCLTYFTGYEDRKDSLAFLSFTRSFSGEMELKKIEDITIFPIAVPGGSRTATASVTFTMLGEEGTDQMELKEVDSTWKIIWEQGPPISAYQLTHSAEDIEYILNWDFIVSKCPDIGAYDKQEIFLRRGESKQSATGETTTTTHGMNEPAAWMSMRSVLSSLTVNNFRGFSVYIAYCDTAEYLDEYIDLMKLRGIPFQEDGDFVTAVLEAEPPIQSIQLHIAGNQFYMLFLCTASSDESLFFDKDTLEELTAIAKSNITSLEITPLPADIPDRIVTGDQNYQWQELMTVRSDELSPAVRVSEGEFYNDMWFVERPLMQVFNFTVDKDWRFVITATGEIGTRFEAYITVSESGDPEHRYSTDQVFKLYSETKTFTWPQPLEEGYAPPVNVEVKVNFNLPLNWVITIEK